MEVTDDCQENEEETGSRYCPLDRCERSIFFCLTFCGYVVPRPDTDDRVTCSLVEQAPRRRPWTREVQAAAA